MRNLMAKHTALQSVMQDAYACVMEIDDEDVPLVPDPDGESPRKIRRRMKLSELLRENGGAAQVARESGTPKSHFSAILNGRRGVGDALAAKLESIYNKPDGWFDGPIHHVLEAAPGVINLSDNPDYPAIRRVKFKLSAGASGFGVEYHDEDGAPIVFRKDWFDRNGYKPKSLFAVRVSNGSMEPGLFDGDTVVVNTDNTMPRDGVVFAVNYEGEMVIKRLVRDGGQWWLASDNPDQRRYPKKICDEHSIIIGEVVHKQSERI